mmetsp:Transcript_21579/g.46940  ORF Transcript_21579/g.46940 Transcript_21579/m.46940 type:complete len:230 (-) Transcript_21579:798-1487(-)
MVFAEGAGCGGDGYCFGCLHGLFHRHAGTNCSIIICLCLRNSIRIMVGNYRHNIILNPSFLDAIPHTRFHLAISRSQSVKTFHTLAAIIPSMILHHISQQVNHPLPLIHSHIRSDSIIFTNHQHILPLTNRSQGINRSNPRDQRRINQSNLRNFGYRHKYRSLLVVFILPHALGGVGIPIRRFCPSRGPVDGSSASECGRLGQGPTDGSIVQYGYVPAEVIDCGTGGDG